MLERMYRWTLARAGMPSATLWLGTISFAESSFFPLPPDLLLVPMVLAQRARWLSLSLICTATSVIGGMFGYAIGYYFFQTVGVAIVGIYHLESQFAVFEQAFRDYGVWIILIKGMTPIPYKLLTITAGVAQLDLVAFLAASVVSRGVRFLLVSVLVYRYGPYFQGVLEKRLKLISFLILASVVAGFLVLKLL